MKKIFWMIFCLSSTLTTSINIYRFCTFQFMNTDDGTGMGWSPTRSGTRAGRDTCGAGTFKIAIPALVLPDYSGNTSAGMAISNV